MGKIVIVGGGAVGLSVAYHLGARSAADVLLLERHQLTSGTSWHAAGIVGPLRATPNMTRIAMYAEECFRKLEKQTGLSTGYKQTGGYWLARKPERMDELQRIAALGQHFGLQCEVLNTAQLIAQLPYLDLASHQGGIRVAEDANVNPVDLCMAYAKAAREYGVTIKENCEVAELCVNQGQATGVCLADGSVIDADITVLCAGAWSKPLAQRAGLALPLQAVEHMYVVTEPVQSTENQIHDPFPVIRDLDTGIYLKGDSGGKLILGGFEPNAKCWNAFSNEGRQPFIELPEDWEQFEPFMQAGLKLMPSLHTTGIQRFMNGPESFTADTKPLVGLAPAVNNLFVAAGMNSVGVMSSAGIGKVLADWITDGHAPSDLWEVDVARCDPASADDSHMQQRMTESVSDLFAMHWPYKQQSAGRNLRQSVLHDRWQSLGAVFGVTGGLERGLWFAADQSEQSLPYSTSRQTWQSVAEREAAVLKSGVSLLDLSAFSKFDIHDNEALPFLQHIATANLDVSPGRCTYTTILNNAGGIEADVTVTRIDYHHFRLVSGGATRWRDKAMLRRASTNYKVSIDDVTEQEEVLGVMGIGTRDLIMSLSDDDWTEFPFSTSRKVTVVGISCRATRLSYIGEPGWELNVSTEHAHRVFDSLHNAGALPFGQHALNSCRIEKRFLHWGHDIGSDVSPIEAGLERTIDWSKEFIGKQSLLEQKNSRPDRKLHLFQVHGEPLLLHDELIYSDDHVVGLTTSGTQGVRTGLFLSIGLIDTGGESLDELCKREFHIDVAGVRYPATLLPRAAHDPANEYTCQ